MHTEPQKEHGWLHRLVGNWTFEIEMKLGPDEPPQTFKGTESVRSLGGLWTLGEAQGEMPGGVTTMLMTLGYDTNKQRFVGTFIGAVSDYLWVYDGELDSAGKVLTLNADGPDMSLEGKGRMTKYRDLIEFQSDQHRTLRSFVLGTDGEWTEMMTSSYRRT